MEKLWISQVKLNLDYQQKKKNIFGLHSKTKEKPSGTFSQKSSKELKVYGFNQFNL